MSQSNSLRESPFKNQQRTPISPPIETQAGDAHPWRTLNPEEVLKNAARYARLRVLAVSSFGFANGGFAALPPDREKERPG